VTSPGPEQQRVPETPTPGDAPRQPRRDADHGCCSPRHGWERGSASRMLGARTGGMLGTGQPGTPPHHACARPAPRTPNHRPPRAWEHTDRGAQKTLRFAAASAAAMTQGQERVSAPLPNTLPGCSRRRSTQPHWYFGQTQGHGGRRRGPAAGHPGTAATGAPMGEPLHAQAWRARGSRCPARRALLLQLLRLPMLEFSFAPVIKTNRVNTAAGTRLRRRTPAAAGSGEGMGSGTPHGARCLRPGLGAGGSAGNPGPAPPSPGAKPPMPASPASSPRLGQPRAPPRASRQLRCQPGRSPCPPCPRALGAGAAPGAQPRASDIPAAIAVRRPGSTLRRRFPVLSGGLMPTGDLFSCHRPC